MLGKLFKYELKDLFKKTVLIFSIVIGLSLLVFGFGKLAEIHEVFTYFNVLFIIGYVLAIAGMMLYSVIYPMIRYYNSMLKDEAYLTHTLPVTKVQLLFTKLTCAFVLFLASCLVFLLSLLLLDVIDFNLIKIIINMFDASVLVAIIVSILYLIIYYFSIVMLVITAMTLGHSMPVKKGTYSVVFGIAIYAVQQVLGMIAFAIMFIAMPNFIDKIDSGNFNLLILLIIPSIIYFIVLSVEIYLTHYNLKNRLNLE